MKKFCQKYKRIKLSCVMSFDIHTPDGFRSSGADAGICVPYEIQQDGDFDVIPFIRRPLKFLFNAKHPLAKFAEVDPSSLSEEEPIFMLTVSHLRRPAGRVGMDFWRIGIDPERLVQVESFDAIVFMVAIGLGVGLLPCYDFDDSTGTVKSAAVKGAAPYGDLAIVYAKANCNPALQLFLQMFKEEYTPIKL
jgi:DNA-binding transcriptional LysR family regulator